MKKYIPILAAAGLVLILCIAMAATFLIKRYTPTNEREDLATYFHVNSDNQSAIVLNGELIEEQTVNMEGHAYVDYSLLHDKLDSRYYWDANECKLLYTTADTTYMVESGSEDYYKGNKKNSLEAGVLVRLTEDKVLVNLEYAKMLSTMEIAAFEKPNRLVISTVKREIKQAVVEDDAKVRVRGGIKSKILTEVKEKDVVEVLEVLDSWTKVLTSDGVCGYIKNSELEDAKDVTVVLEERNSDFEHEFVEGTINLAWHQVTNATSNSQVASVLAQTKGINVISPTWFYLNNSKGSINSIASKDYVNYCHSQGVAVWGLVSNLEDKSVDTTQVLTTTTYRETLVSNLISKAIEYKLDGINVDIESVAPEVGDGYIQFIRELSLRCHANGIVLSVDNYVPTDYTAFYRRKEQANYADYIVVMAYDEHYAGSDAGSVSSIGFVKSGVENTLKEVPANQIVLGLPFYTRVWELTPVTNDDGEILSYDTKSEAVGMNTSKNMAKVNGADIIWNEECGQNYAEYENSGKTYQIWFEDETSMELKLALATENKLAGVAFWKLGFESNAIWNTISKYIQ